MESCDVAIVGGGPAGSTCAWKLCQSALDVVVLDKAHFPRDKICAGWITPQVVDALDLDIVEYSSARVFQPFHGFRVALSGRPGVDVEFARPVSYGIRRCEFDDYLLKRSPARLKLGEAVTSIERINGGWCLNGNLQARMLVGAGGHFCPIARYLRAGTGNPAPLVTAVEVEFPLPVDAECTEPKWTNPRLYFRNDFSGYGWCVRKGHYLNIGIGIVDSRQTASEVPQLLSELNREGAYADKIPSRFRGHAYHLYDGCRSKMLDDNILLIGDAAGLAYAQSGEGIRPAVESGLIAAQVIVEAEGQYDRLKLERYQERITARLGKPPRWQFDGSLSRFVQNIRSRIGRQLFKSSRFVRDVVIRESFLRSDQPPLHV